jgi:hypothetical protein
MGRDALQSFGTALWVLLNLSVTWNNREEIRWKFQCSAYDTPILNRKIDRCFCCGATLPQELLFLPAKIAVLDEETRKQEDRTRRYSAPQIVEQSGFFWNSIDPIDIISDLRGLFD